jgi:hypothetical protein
LEKVLFMEEKRETSGVLVKKPEQEDVLKDMGVD